MEKEAFELEVRFGTPADYPAALAIQHKAYGLKEAPLYGPDLPPLHETPETLATEVAAGTALLVGVHGGRIVASMRRKIKEDGSAYFYRLSVNPDLQGRGIGQRMMLAAEGLHPDAPGYVLDCGDKSAENMHIYEKIGYRKTGAVIQVPNGPRCLEMRKPNRRQGESMYDLIILGAGPAGYVAAEHAGGMGKKVLLIEKDKLGGVCLNRGCIPTKSFLNSAKLYDHARHAGVFGVTAKDAAFDYGIMKARTEKLQGTLRNGIAAMMKKNKVEIVTGAGTILDKNRIKVGDTVYEGANLLLCPGSRPAFPPIPGLKDNPAVVDSTGILNAPAPAESLVIVGGGVIGIEFACFYALVGKKVTVVEMLPQICGNLDKELAVTVQRKLESKGVAIHTGAKVEKIEGNAVHFVDKQGAAQSVSADLILAATGRVANLEGIGLENLNLAMDKRHIIVNERAETSVPRVYAAGDATGRYQLAHFASRQGLVAVNNMFGRRDVCRESAIPGVIYTDPEIATVGLTEDQAKAAGAKPRTVKMPLGASGRFLAETEGERGFVKAVLDERGVLLGMHIVGPYASEMIGAACVMIENEMRARDIQEVVFPHPTVAEIMKEAMFL